MTNLVPSKDALGTELVIPTYQHSRKTSQRVKLPPKMPSTSSMQVTATPGVKETIETNTTLSKALSGYKTASGPVSRGAQSNGAKVTVEPVKPDDFVEVKRTKTRGNRTQVLLIHDRHHKDFDSGIFDRRMEVSRLQANSSAGLYKQEKLATAIKISNLSVIILHLGMDVTSYSTTRMLIRVSNITDVRELLDHLLANTDARICVS